MIRLHRPPEPASLPPERAIRLAAARLAVAAGRAVARGGYGIVKPDLYAMQHHKCCYCEKREEQDKYRDVEHFRPLSTYWWLGWTWENLLFSCWDCNREYKRNQFPLRPGSTPLVAEHAPPGDEVPLLLDPADPAIDPMDEIQFRRVKIHSREYWKPFGLTDRGWATIRVCGLDRATILDHYTAHVRDAVRPKLEPFFAAHKCGETRDAVDAWNRARRGLLGPARPFRALSHDALGVLVPATMRAQYRLELTRPA